MIARASAATASWARSSLVQTALARNDAISAKSVPTSEGSIGGKSTRATSQSRSGRQRDAATTTAAQDSAAARTDAAIDQSSSAWNAPGMAGGPRPSQERPSIMPCASRP